MNSLPNTPSSIILHTWSPSQVTAGPSKPSYILWSYLRPLGVAYMVTPHHGGAYGIEAGSGPSEEARNSCRVLGCLKFPDLPEPLN